MKAKLWLVLVISLLVSATAIRAADALAAGFKNPPESAKPMTWWHWMNGNVTKEGITLDLEAMKRIGLGGAQIFNVDYNIPPGPVKFMSPEWLDLTRFAIQEADRLGLQLGFHNCAGWSSSGGPWITPAQAMQTVVTSELHLTGPQHFAGALPRPFTRLDFYRDEAVLAFPTPAGDRTNLIENFPPKAGFTNVVVKDTWPLPAIPAEAAVRSSSQIDLTRRLQANGHLDWDVPPGDWTVLRVGYTPTGRQNHPSPLEGLGLECDKFSKAALDTHWANMMQPILNVAGRLSPRTLNNVLIDSWEANAQNWSAGFREEFRKRRGYDLTRFLPVFTGRVVENLEATERFLFDVRRTISDLMADNYYGHFQELCHQHGMISAIEPYTGPYESLQIGAKADLPMDEFWFGTPDPHALIKLASSAGHIYGKTVIGAESFTGRADPMGRWQASPYSLKMLGDLEFCTGINRFIFHRYAMQPWTNRWPGMTMGKWGIHFERTETWWEQGRAYIQYLDRCQFLLQQGRFVADACYFDGENAPVELRANDPALPPGYDYDGIDADVLLHRATMKNRRLTLPDGLSYGILVLPPASRAISPALLRKLRGFVADGLTLVGPRPLSAPGLQDYPRCDAEVNLLATELWANCDGQSVTEHAIGQGRVVWNKPMAEVLRELALPPDFDYPNPHPDPRRWDGAYDDTTQPGSKLTYIHRQAGSSEIYFVSNQRERSDTVRCTFRVSGKVPELWHPDTGLIERAPIWQAKAGQIELPLTFDPSGSVFVIFRTGSSGEHAITATRDGQPVSPAELSVDRRGHLDLAPSHPGHYELVTAKGRKLQAEVTNVPAPQEVTGSWKVTFPPNWGAPPSATFDPLSSWSDNALPGIKYFSGTATYHKTLMVPADLLKDHRRLYLDLGRVEVIAEASINGQDLGVLWKPPFRVEVTDLLYLGANLLEVKVANLWPNRLIGDEALAADSEWKGQTLVKWPQWLLDNKPNPTGRLTFTTWQHWTNGTPLLESGLIGPVKLEPVDTVTLR